ncbi:MAG TPA: hypothetical protein PLW05_09565, partial [Candidatus Marinimicrobia bacterium]|nr:hypothetical protein [Candidatus Neomarinimicrobiota bacterium]
NRLKSLFYVLVMWSWSGSPPDRCQSGREPATFPTNRDALPLLTGISRAVPPDQLILVSRAGS